MRSDRGTTLAAILVVLCCFGGPIAAESFVTHQVFVGSVASSHSRVVVKRVSKLFALTSDFIGLKPNVVLFYCFEDEIVDYHNLPPPLS